MGFFDWNAHFVVFSGGVEQGLGGPTARSSLKIRQNGGWEARRLDPAGMIIPPCCSRNPGRRRWWAVPRVPIWVFFYLKWRWALNQEITDSAAQQGWCPRSAACNSWCIHHPAVCDGRMCTAGTRAGRVDGPIWLKHKFAKTGAERPPCCCSFCFTFNSPFFKISSTDCCFFHSLHIYEPW